MHPRKRLILGINHSHNSSACLLGDGAVIAALQEERPTRLKNCHRFPVSAIKELLQSAGCSMSDLDIVAYAGKQLVAPLRPSTDNLTHLYRRFRGRRFGGRARLAVLEGMDALRIRRASPDAEASAHANRALLQREFPGERLPQVQFLDHHDCHFATACFGSQPADGDKLVFTYDGMGDGRCATVSRVRPDGSRDLLSAVDAFHSIAEAWQVVTYLMGFTPMEHEYKLMGMAPYATSAGSHAVAALLERQWQWNGHHHELSGRRPTQDWELHTRHVMSLWEQVAEARRFDDLCGGLQLFTERAITRWVSHWVESTNIRRICLSGGMFLNVKVNKEILALPGVQEVFCFPSCGDETNAIGACYLAHFESTGTSPKPLSNLYLNPPTQDLAGTLDRLAGDVSVKLCSDVDDEVARLLARGEIVARFVGRGEFGARALGNRSILASPSRMETVGTLNRMIKMRDFWMPFACSILAEDQHRYIENPKRHSGQYMIMAFAGGPEVRSIIAGAHPQDLTVRAQIVDEEQSPRYHRLITRFREQTGIGAVLNTSFNLHGEPMVHTASDAISVFQRSNLRHLAMEDYLLSKSCPPDSSVLS